ncbi:DUF2798 domain-containing protein [Pedobacter sp. ASV28]|uniref:DUF2798 domain-containing protein n=1 Tax=Pedobacter sp. ASV28 TaxID=2795123 RepID=UPI00351C1202
MQIALHWIEAVRSAEEERIRLTLTMEAITKGIAALTKSAINIGFTHHFLIIWLKSWPIAYLVAVSSILRIAPPMERWIDYLLERKILR